MFFYWFKNTPKLTILLFIKVYQKTLSLDHSPLEIFKPFGQCKFRPTCSEYSYQAVRKYGALKGGLMALKRLFRCHPWSDGGYDPVK